MANSGEYKTTLFDRHGPDAVHLVRTFAYGLMIFGLVFGITMAFVGFHWWIFPVAVVCGAAGSGLGFVIGHTAGKTWKHLLVDGSSTPYVEQYSYQQALVMKGDIDGALESFEEVIVQQPTAISPRVKAAELYARDKRNHQRAAELFREVQRIPTVSAGEDIYVTNRLVDLLTGPLGDPGRALVELRRLIDRHPQSPAAEHARAALSELKSQMTRGA